MSVISVENGRIEVDMEADVLTLPEIIDTELLDAVFACSPGEPAHIAELHARMRPVDKDRFEQACRDAGQDYAQKWAQAYVSWATVGTVSGAWDLGSIEVLLKRDIHSWLIDNLYADRFGFWFAECILPKTGRIILSDAEFQLRYGDSFAEHLRKVIDFLPIRLGQMIDALEKPWVEYVVQCSTPKGAVTETRRGPPNIPPREWLFPAGYTFLAAVRA